MRQKTIIVLFYFLAFFSCKTETNPEDNSESIKESVSSFQALKTSDSINIDGLMNEEIWGMAQVAGFDYFYNDEKPSDKQKSTFRALWNDESLFFFYEFEDKYLTARETKRDGLPFLDDCAEVFLIPVPEALDTHFCFEINLNKAANDIIYFNNYYKENHVGFKPFNPEYKIEINYKGTINNNSDIDEGWTMELEIPISVFGFLADFEPVKTGNKWMFLALRQERNEVEGERRVTSTIFPFQDYKKDFHQPEEFGYLEFVDK
ncbi:MAG: carbohydrate-binding family 9-like protein [Jejuia sp.]